ncbi:hypothetical protein [Amycolatopsis sp. NPDC021455]|uniref:hypothetical protein n=1 Tax=Amycolatopsis sp. NPDC021455 TaxID=3154901 RepID=UPI0033F7EC1B
MKTAVRAGLAALLAGATVLVAPAQAATVVQRTAVCQDGDFRGSFTLRYEASGTSYHLIGGITTSGPYIGDSAGTIALRISYRSGTTVHTVYTRSVSTTTGSTTFAMPSGTDVPIRSFGTAATTFDNGVNSCVATVQLP